MAIVNFTVPDDVKKAFDRAFERQNKSAVIADLMRQAVANTELQQRRSALFQELTSRRSSRPPLETAESHSLRIAGRP